MNVMILNDAGFWLGGGKAGSGKEMYCEILSNLNVKLGNNVLKLSVGRERGSEADVILLEGFRGRCNTPGGLKGSVYSNAL